MKKIISLLLICFLLVSCVACGNEKSPEERLEKEAIVFIQTYVEEVLGVGGWAVEIERKALLKENKWALLTHVFKPSSNEPDGLIDLEIAFTATYDDKTKEFTFGDVEVNS